MNTKIFCNAMRAILISALLTACAAQIAIPGGDSVRVSKPGANIGIGSDPTILSHISPALPPSERAFMYGVLAKLPPRFRWNVYDLERDGTVHVNDPALLPNVRVVRAVPGLHGYVTDMLGNL